MRLQLEGIQNAYYVQMLCMLLFPGENFHNDAGPLVRLSVSADAVQCRVILHVDACGQCFTIFKVQPQGSSSLQGEKLCVGFAFLEAFEHLYGEKPPYGILTGVRPGKLALRALLAGQSPEQTKHLFTEEYGVSTEKTDLIMTVASFEKEVLRAMPAKSCSVYISIPFCPTRCSYCSFVSFATKHLLDQIPAYLEQLCADIRQTGTLIRSLGLRVATIYIGGGTPTILQPEQLAYLLHTVCTAIDLSYLQEFTLEAGRPDTITMEKLCIAAKNGITRVSINPQTRNETVLKSIGRNHTEAQLLQAFENARNSSIPFINTDLIAGLPGESLQSFQDSVDRTIALGPENLTVHTFCVKKAADLRQEKANIFMQHAALPALMVQYARESACSTGYQPYYLYRQKNTVGNQENVGYALPGTECLYNVYMMEEFHTVFGCGAGAVTRLVNSDRTEIQRIFSAKYPYEYLEGRKSSVSAESIARIYRFFERDGDTVDRENDSD